MSGVNGVAITTDDILLFVAAIGAYRRLHPQVPDEPSARVLLAYEVAQREGHPRALALLSRVEALTDLLHARHLGHRGGGPRPLPDWTRDGTQDDAGSSSRAAVFAAAATHPLIWTATGYAFERQSFLARVRMLLDGQAPDVHARPDEDERDSRSPA